MNLRQKSLVGQNGPKDIPKRKPFPDGSKSHLGPVLILVDHITNLEMVILSAMCALEESFTKYILPPC